jgi:hypothetical protein
VVPKPTSGPPQEQSGGCYRRLDPAVDIVVSARLLLRKVRWSDGRMRGPKEPPSTVQIDIGSCADPMSSERRSEGR